MRDRADAPQAILEAALHLVGQEGMSALTHRRVAEIAGVSLLAKTYDFRSKAQILERASSWPRNGTLSSFRPFMTGSTPPP